MIWAGRSEVVDEERYDVICVHGDTLLVQMPAVSLAPLNIGLSPTGWGFPVAYEPRLEPRRAHLELRQDSVMRRSAEDAVKYIFKLYVFFTFCWAAETLRI